MYARRRSSSLSIRNNLKNASLARSEGLKLIFSVVIVIEIGGNEGVPGLDMGVADRLGAGVGGNGVVLRGGTGVSLRVGTGVALRDGTGRLGISVGGISVRGTSASRGRLKAEGVGIVAGIPRARVDHFGNNFRVSA